MSTDAGAINPLPLWVVVVPIVLVSTIVAVFGGYRHRQKYPAPSIEETSTAVESASQSKTAREAKVKNESFAINKEPMDSPPAAAPVVLDPNINYDDL